MRRGRTAGGIARAEQLEDGRPAGTGAPARVAASLVEEPRVIDGEATLLLSVADEVIGAPATATPSGSENMVREPAMVAAGATLPLAPGPKRRYRSVLKFVT